MPKYAFEAKGANGKDLRGEVEASNEQEARIKLRSQRMVPVRLVPKERNVSVVKKVGAKGVSAKELQIFTRQLATLLGSGIPILQSIDTLAKGSRSPGLAAALVDVSATVTQGKRFAEALMDHPRVFDRFYVNMVRAG